MCEAISEEGKTTKPPKETRLPVLYCRLPPHLYDKLTKLAEAEQRSRSAMVRHLIAVARL